MSSVIHFQSWDYSSPSSRQAPGWSSLRQWHSNKCVGFLLLWFTGSHQIFGFLHSYCVLVSSLLASASRATSEISRDCALEASCRRLPTRTKGPQKLYHGTFVQLENLFSSHTMHSRLLPDLLAPGTTPALQLPALDMTWSLRGQTWSQLNQELKVQIYKNTARTALGSLLCPLEPLSLFKGWLAVGTVWATGDPLWSWLWKILE